MAKRKRTTPKPNFFDLNIPYTPSNTTKLTTPKTKTKSKLISKALELGYTGIAYNHSIKGGAMSNSDVCTIPFLPLSSLLQTNPNLPNSVKFHREALGADVSTPFRQYTRLTVAIDSLIQGSALNSGNPVLKSYDLVAVRPMNQATFDHACKAAEVDLIAIDFSEKLGFRLDFHTVKVAIKRGVYFEITYSPLIFDVHKRRQTILNSKLLVEWTRGKNLIFSSGAASASELRGPCDVANLSSLLGLSSERAKTSMSNNCRLLLCSAIRKKQYYKNAVKVEPILSKEVLNSKGPWFCEVNGWDIISSGEGDLLLNDTTNSSSAPSERPKIPKAIDFASIAEEMSSNSFPLKDWLTPSKVSTS